MDRPEVLKNYLGKFQADFTNWHALTGYSEQQIREFARESFKTLVQKDPKSDQFIQGTKFFLVDRSGTVVTSYDGLTPDFDKIIKDIKSLQK